MRIFAAVGDFSLLRRKTADSNKYMRLASVDRPPFVGAVATGIAALADISRTDCTIVFHGLV